MTRIRRIAPDDLRDLARSAGFRIASGDIAEYHALTDSMLGTIERFAALPDPPPHVTATSVRDAGRRPTPAEDPLNAIARVCEVRGTTTTGPLSGVRVGLKDMIPIAGVPLTFGSAVLRNYVPDFDSELTRRLLEAGAEIAAVTNMEAFAFSGGGETCAAGPVLNPYDPARTACGSSNGSAAGLAYNDFTLAWGTDSGGSVRIPASWCGVLGHKPTHGLVPFTGILTSDWRYDHAGPLARTVHDIARALDAVAPRGVPDFDYPADPRVQEPVALLTAVEQAPETLEGVRIGVVREGFASGDPSEHPPGTFETSAAVREALDRMARLGATVEEITLPELISGADIMFSAMVETATAAAAGWPTGYHWFSESSPQLAAGMAEAMRSYADEMPDTFKLVTLVGHYLRERYGGAIAARAHAMAGSVRKAFDAPLEAHDVLVLPTTTHYPHLHLPEASISERVNRGWGMLGNASAFNVTGHPALSMPAASADGLPVGVMVVGRRFDDARVLSLARTYERAYGWEPELPATAA